MSEEKKASTRARVFTYTAQDGTVYYSFTRKQNIITPGQILELESRIGQHLENFIREFRAESKKFVGRQFEEDDE